MDKETKIIVGISIGDLNGIGLEVILKTFADKRILDFCTPVIFGSTKVFSYHKKAINSETQSFGIQNLESLQEGKLNLLNVWKEDVSLNLGTATKDSGNYALKSLEAATTALSEGKIDVLLTAPISKDNIQSEEFEFPGHTEYLESKLEGDSLMILMTEHLRMGLITGHIPVSKVAESITKELIVRKVNIMYASLVQDFGISKPKIAVLGLNPHCGDNGVIGNEDEELIRPTLKEIQETGKLVYGPFAADGFFGSESYQQFDGVLAMYHDQGLVAFKTLAFGNGVNFTAGLSGIRVSPDHGTAFEIAGKGIANNSSFSEALHVGLQIFKKRSSSKSLRKNSLRVKKQY
ncbi:4-hydroxythreonine-4-phosphate dehydrogenase PdxA [Flavicella sediminum]|uniref:4-hydroxythreonine-4-phosphate dehydrogenase PdxA n=1 Tax=Flavicella sediminum TaxID=2585141 RepID=UPI00111CB6C1|nr:4-hydroxythreonine-4-phosphate dehydrogenase PdxA [Flavicella sediminum]